MVNRDNNNGIKGFFSTERVFYIKLTIIVAAMVILVIKSEQKFSNPLIILLVLWAGYYLGKLTCQVYFKNTGIGLTLFFFVLMNIVHSFIDGIGINGQPFFYWVSAVSGHEAIRQPTLYILLWAILQPISMNSYLKVVICLFSVTGAWLLGIWFGKLNGAYLGHFYNLAQLMGYSLFLFIGDIFHHLIDQYGFIRKRKKAEAK